MWWKGRKRQAHRLAFALENGPITRGARILHRCRHLHCIAPGHLYAGSQVDVSRKTRQSRGERNGNHKLTARQVRAIRRARGTQVTIAKRFDLSVTTVSLIRRHIAWAHLH